MDNLGGTTENSRMAWWIADLSREVSPEQAEELAQEFEGSAMDRLRKVSQAVPVNYRRTDVPFSVYDQLINGEVRK